MCVCMCVRVYVCMYVCMYACMYVSMSVCMHACMHVCMHVCMHIYANISPAHSRAHANCGALGVGGCVQRDEKSFGELGCPPGRRGGENTRTHTAAHIHRHPHARTLRRHMDTPSSVGPTASGPQSALIRATFALTSAGDGAAYRTCQAPGETQALSQSHTRSNTPAACARARMNFRMPLPARPHAPHRASRVCGRVVAPGRGFGKGRELLDRAVQVLEQAAQVQVWEKLRPLSRPECGRIAAAGREREREREERDAASGVHGGRADVLMNAWYKSTPTVYTPFVRGCPSGSFSL